jgi:hypothetical protein
MRERDLRLLLSPLVFGITLTLSSEYANAQEPAPPPVAAQEPASPAEVPAESPPPRPRPAPYSLPFQLRPVVASTALRSDSSLASYENAKAQPGFAVVSSLVGSLRIPGTGDKPGTGLAPLIKLTVVNDSPPGTATGGFAFVNPLVGASYALSLGSGWRASGFLGVTIPIGMGGGDTPDKGALDARTVGPIARADMDNSLFAVNDLAIIPGIDLAYVAYGFTAQVEATLFQLERVRGSAAQPEASKTNLTAGFHAGYFFIPNLSFGAEVRYQRWLNAPIAVDKDKPGTSVDMVSLGFGPRLHFQVGSVWLRPGVAFTRGFDHPMTSPGNYNVVQLDVPVVF